MKKWILWALMLSVTSALTLTACGRQKAPQSQTDNAPQEANTPSEETQAAPETAETEAADDSAVPETVSFIVDITDNLAQEGGQIIGNTASLSAYSGIITILLDETLVQKAAAELQVGSTYLFTVKPMMTMSIPPQVIALDFVPATEADIAELEKIRSQISNFADCMERYQDMSLEEIVQDANFNYAIWTQEEISEFQAFLSQLGYTKDSPMVSYVNTRAQLSSSIAAPKTD